MNERGRKATATADETLAAAREAGRELVSAVLRILAVGHNDRTMLFPVESMVRAIVGEKHVIWLLDAVGKAAATDAAEEVSIGRSALVADMLGRVAEAYGLFASKGGRSPQELELELWHALAELRAGREPLTEKSVKSIAGALHELDAAVTTCFVVMTQEGEADLRHRLNAHFTDVLDGIRSSPEDAAGFSELEMGLLKQQAGGHTPTGVPMMTAAFLRILRKKLLKGGEMDLFAWLTSCWRLPDDLAKEVVRTVALSRQLA